MNFGVCTQQLVLEHYVPNTGQGQKFYSQSKGLPLLKTVQWLPIASRVKSKILDVTHKAVGDQTSLPPSSAPSHWGFAKVHNKAKPPSFPGVFTP